jgi:hypothetical protein
MDEKWTNNRAQNGVAEERRKKGAREQLFWPKCSPGVPKKSPRASKGSQKELKMRPKSHHKFRPKKRSKIKELDVLDLLGFSVRRPGRHSRGGRGEVGRGDPSRIRSNISTGFQRRRPRAAD